MTLRLLDAFNFSVHRCSQLTKVLRLPLEILLLLFVKDVAMAYRNNMLASDGNFKRRDKRSNKNLRSQFIESKVAERCNPAMVCRVIPIKIGVPFQIGSIEAELAHPMKWVSEIVKHCQANPQSINVCGPFSSDRISVLFIGNGEYGRNSHDRSERLKPSRDIRGLVRLVVKKYYRARDKHQCAEWPRPSVNFHSAPSGDFRGILA
ncbi:hypothetical protein [Paraburkholderia elongata]|uniref:Uncharacterized protein n=1 Tax=Paraburkholderia elongata TaxID=2675747 RepID=A0A972SL34_9BURK|nr:hypothetical protein [Paraburkholderia elongata]NPT59698.1 hypothetical protein [Paraburkholderia elongata]